MSNKHVNQSLSPSNLIPVEVLDTPVEPELPIMADIGINAAVAAVMSGLNEMMREGGKSLEDFRAGKIDEKQFTYRLVHKATEAASRNGIRTGSALVMSEGAKSMLTKAFGKALVKRLSRYNLITAICFGLVDQGRHTLDLAKGKMDSREYKVKSVENVGGTGGAISGATAGVVLGSIVPGLGSAAGGMMGYMMGMLGSMGGGALGRSLGEKWFPGEGDDGSSGPSSPINRIDIPIGD